jgi:toluene monooxygenase system protein E
VTDRLQPGTFDAVPKTFAWFEGRRRPPSEYEELTVGLHFGEEPLVSTRVGTWSLDNTRLANVPWEDFRDPAQLHYRTWVALQDWAEGNFAATLDLAQQGGFIEGLDGGWRAEMATLSGGLAFAEWGVAMAMQYVERFCLSSAVAQAAQLQVCDELRHAQRALEWSDALRGAGASAEGDEDPARAAWMEHSALQPLRKAVELALTIEDWGEVIVAVNVCLEGLLQPFQREVYLNASRAQRDMGSAMLGQHCWVDEDRHLAWTESFLRMVTEADSANQAILQGWYETHAPAAQAALDALAAGFPLDGVGEQAAEVARTELAKRFEGIETT